MSKLDIPMQGASRKADPLHVKANPPMTQEGDATGEAAAGGDFGALLQGLTEGKDGQSANGQRPVLESSMLTALAEYSRSVQPDKEGSEKDVLADVPVDAGQTQLLEQVIALAAQAGFAPAKEAERQSISDARQSSQVASSTPLTDLMGPLLEGGEDTDIVQNLTNAPALKASVVHQETHFKPILPAPNLHDAKRSESDTDGSEAQEGDLEAAKRAIASDAERAFRSKMQSGSLAQGGREISASAASPSEKKDEASLPSPMLHKIANAVLAEAGSRGGKVDLGTQRTGTSAPVFTIKASEGAVRVLSLQLHPVELGLVTVKMRLSGDRLEMELHASSDETARLLRNDSDKLSGLLKASGYQPDVITIQSNGSDLSQQNSSWGQRPPSGSSLQQQPEGFQQGMANQDGRPRKQSDGFEREETNNGKVSTEETAGTNRSAGGVYL